MERWLLKALVIGFVAWLAWSMVQPRYVFVIRVQGGEPRLRRGKVTPAFLGRLAEACRAAGVARGWVSGVQQGRRTALRFSRDFPPGLRQRLRNEWQAAS